ncbi:MAG: type VI secretion system ATPase TssH [Gammaproteobacteria bacterium]|nr:MAG: type VI secretion system ATPase TssH [Gammaproteobacteria bacterium]
MTSINRSAIFGKLNSLAYRAVEAAFNFSKLRNNSHVEITHWVHQILQLQDSDLHRLIKHYDLDSSKLMADITQSLDQLPRGTTSQVNFSAYIDQTIEHAWLKASLLFNESQIRTGYLIVGMLDSRDLAAQLYQVSEQFKKIKLDDLVAGFDAITGNSPEASMSAKDGFNSAPAEGRSELAGVGEGQQALAQYTVDLTEDARNGKQDPIVGRDQEIRQMVDVLMRRKQNNPILVGEAGVGKTAAVEGFAQRIVRGDVPPSLRNVSLRSLDIGLLQAGASMKGEFEQRLRQVIDEVQASEKPIILFIDEAHTLIGAGGAAGTGDAANLLKPALARGTLRTIAATTWAEYKKHIEKDPALTRRFQVIQIDEPSEEKAVLMMRGIASSMESHHKVQVLDEALEAAVKLSHRYIPARQLPDKSVSLLDTAAARVAISQHAVPGEVDDLRKLISALNTELEIIDREANMGIEIAEKRDKVLARLDDAEGQLVAVEARWQEEKTLVTEILSLRSKLRQGAKTVDASEDSESGDLNNDPEFDSNVSNDNVSDASAEGESVLIGELGESENESETQYSDAERKEFLESLKALQVELTRLQGEDPLILPTVDAHAVAAVVQDWTGIPVGRMVKNEIETVLNLPSLLAERIIGQDHALEMIAKRIQTSRANMDNPNKPIGVFMLAGTSGVGKTETALALAESLYGGEHNIVTINMSEFQEAHSVSTLKGAPPGYVGYGEGGILTEAVRRKPYSVVLLDEVEKAHSDVHEIFFQVFDKGQMEDGEGRVIDFRNTLILLTTNAGTELIKGLCKDPELMPSSDGIAKALHEPLTKEFPPALLGRLVVIPYYPLTPDMLKKIAKLQIARVQQRIQTHHEIDLNYQDSVLDLIVNRCNELDSGGRMIDSILTNTVLPIVSNEILRKGVDGETISTIELGVEDESFTYQFN